MSATDASGILGVIGGILFFFGCMAADLMTCDARLKRKIVLWICAVTILLVAPIVFRLYSIALLG